MSINGYINPAAKRITVYYEGSDTIYEGQAMCFNYDTTDNWLGWGEATAGASKTAQGTTADGHQNEGKWIRVEKPATANFLFFAGVVASGSWVGTSGPKAIDIYVPNGAIVAVRAESSCTAGTTKLYLKNSDYDVSSTATANGFIGVAMETVDRSSTNGLVLVKLQDPMSGKGSLDSIETIASDNTVAIASVETIASDNAVAIASVETIASDNTVAIASVETIASDNAVAIASIETIASDNAVAIASVETVASDAQVEIDSISDGLASGLRLASDALTSYTGTNKVSALQGQLRKAFSDLIVAVG